MKLVQTATYSGIEPEIFLDLVASIHVTLMPEQDADSLIKIYANNVGIFEERIVIEKDERDATLRLREGSDTTNDDYLEVMLALPGHPSVSVDSRMRLTLDGFTGYIYAFEGP